MAGNYLGSHSFYWSQTVRQDRKTGYDCGDRDLLH